MPTMGALHEGHLALIKRARKECAIVVVSVFVNPLQFGAHEDLERYPRPFDEDVSTLRKANVDAVFSPTPSEMYPPPALTSVYVSALSKTLEGKTRPTHFKGVTTVVAKLFNIVRPDRAYFGEKDYQQLIVVKRMTRDLNFPVEIACVPTAREKSGLALSSRNAYLNGKERKDAALIYAALSAVRKAYETGVADIKTLQRLMRDVLKKGKTLKLDYIAFVDKRTLGRRKNANGDTRVLIACYAGKTRLIDTMALAEE